MAIELVLLSIAAVLSASALPLIAAAPVLRELRMWDRDKAEMRRIEEERDTIPSPDPIGFRSPPPC